MNRHERRRAAKVGDITFIDRGYLLERDLNYGLPVICYVCGKPHQALGIARIQDRARGTTEHIPLCQACVSSGDGIIQKYWNAPDLEMTEGGECSEEQVIAMADKQDATE